MSNPIEDKKNNQETGLEVAVIGMACRYPGAADLDEFWDVLKNGRESNSFFSSRELEEAGVSSELLKNPDYVKARCILEKSEYFDAAFFGYTPGEARIMDPQVRLFHQCAWHVLEDAGYVPNGYEGLIGLYAGARSSMDWQMKVLMSPGDGSVDFMTSTLLSSRDHLGTRVSYALNLRGPSFTFYTACSTSLVAIHLGCQSVLAGECDIALAGGVTLNHPQLRGYLYQEDMILSPDGHTRSFDAKAQGLVDGSGVGIVALKVLEQARLDKDHIYAVIKGSGINNDGNRKIGYTAPSITGQETLMKDVYATAEVDFESILYVECHGSATNLGDPVEFMALNRAFPSGQGDLCALGSVKTNIGHCDCAAGAASFIKTALAVYHRLLPPSLNFYTPNPKIDLENSSFYVNTRLRELAGGIFPLRAAVNSLGLGGTNAHIIIQEEPEQSPGDDPTSGRSHVILPLSAKTPSALSAMTAKLAEYLKTHPGVNLENMAYTLQKGRREFGWRRAFVCRDGADALSQLWEPEMGAAQPFPAGEKERPLVFMYSGQGSEYIDMGRDLYRTEHSFRADVDHCFDYLTSLLGENIKYILYPQNDQQREAARGKIHRIYYTQPVKFIYEYAYTRLLMRWGLKPTALIGYSFGEYMVACTAGVLRMEDALKLLLKRGEILEKTEPGYLLSVTLSEEELIPLLPAGIYLAGVNTDTHCLVAGKVLDIDAFEQVLTDKEISTLKYRVICGGHSPLMDPILGELGKELEKVTFQPPVIPYVSGLTGTWITKDQAMDPSYFTRQLREPVRFAQALKTLCNNPDTIFLEVGPGTNLVNFARYYRDSGTYPNIQTLTMAPHRKDSTSDDLFLANRLAQLWTFGKFIDWSSYYGDWQGRRLPLPLYPFESQYYWIDLDPYKAVASGLVGKLRGKRPHMEDWLYIPSWKSTLIPRRDKQSGKSRPIWVIFMDLDHKGESLVHVLQQQGESVIQVSNGTGFEQTGPESFQLDYRDESHYKLLFSALNFTGEGSVSVIHMGNILDKDAGILPLDWNRQVQDNGYHSLLALARVLGRLDYRGDINIEVLTNGAQNVAGEPLLYPEKATVLGPVKNIPQEYPNIKCRTLDLQIPTGEATIPQETCRSLVWEFLSKSSNDQVIAYRGRIRLVQQFVPAPLESVQAEEMPIPGLIEGGVYLIAGGLGGVGLILGRYLAEHYKARLILTSRSGLPPREEWSSLLKGQDKVARRIAGVIEMETAGAEVIVAAADVSNREEMVALVDRVQEHFGPINGVIHCGYLADGTVIDQRSRETCERVFLPKIQGTLVLESIFQDRSPLDFFVFCSSMAAIFGPLGQVGYTAANSFQDAFARARMSAGSQATRYLSINWGGWSGTDSFMESVTQLAEQSGLDPQRQIKNAMLPQEGIDVFTRILSSDASQVLVSLEDISFSLAHLNSSATSLGFQEALAEVDFSSKRLKRPNLSTEYLAPRTGTEETLAGVWGELFGLERVGVQDDFFELGGDSLKAMTVSARVRKVLKIKIPIAIFFKNPTIEELANYMTGNLLHEEKNQAAIPLTPIKDDYPLAPVQNYYFNLHREYAGQSLLNVPTTFLLSGDLDLEKLTATFLALIGRHESYRSTFHLLDGEPRQRVLQLDHISFAIDVHQAGEEEIQEKISSLLTPFDLEKAPLFRVFLIQVARGKNILLLDTHQLLVDGTSADIFISEFLTLFGGKELPALNLQYKDFAHWHRQRLSSGALEEAEKFWRGVIDKPVPPLNLPTDFPIEFKPGCAGSPLWFNLGGELYGAMKDLAQNTGTTMFMVWISAYFLLLHGLTRREDIVVGSRIACRPLPELETMVGRFANTLVFRANPDPSHTYREFLEQIRDFSLEAFAHQEYPCEQLGIPYDTLFVYNNKNIATQGNPGELKVSYFGFKKVKTLYKLLFQVSEVGDAVNVLIQYATPLFEEATIQGFKERLLQILSQITRNPEIPLSQCGIPEEVKQILI